MPIRQRIRPLLLLKKQLGHFQRISRNTQAIANREKKIPPLPEGAGFNRRHSIGMKMKVTLDDE